MRAELFVVALGLGLAACAASPTCPEPADAVQAASAYATDACVRRHAMEASVAAADTIYGRLRLEHYALRGAGVDDAAQDWDALPLFSPRVRRLRVNGGTAPDSALEEGPVIDAPPATLASYVAAGRRAFERYPIKIDLGLAQIRDRATAERLGLDVGDDGLVRGAIEVATTTGWTVSLTCAGCHYRNVGGSVLLGVPNDRIDLGALSGDDAWPVGTMDVTDDGIINPMRPADLRAIAYQERLQHTGNLFNGRIARMVRIETLMIGELSRHFRPDREIVAAIALFLEAEGEAVPRPDARHPGAALFASECARCHRGAGLAGPPVRVDVVGTDATATVDGERGTGAYRSPSLLGVADRRLLLHDGSAADLDALLRLVPSEHVGHAFGLALTTEERGHVRDYLAVRSL